MPTEIGIGIGPTFTRVPGSAPGPSFPATAVSFPTGAGFHRSAAGLAVGPSETVSNFSFGFHAMVTEFLQRYNTFASIMRASEPGQLSKYIWIGHDKNAGETPGTRGLAVYDQNGGHSHQLIPLDTWIHIKGTKTGTSLQMWLDDTICTWDTGTGDTFPCAWAEYGGIDKICIGNEFFYEDSPWAGAIRAPYFRRGAMTLAQHQAQAARSSPFLGDGDANAVGGWPFAVSSDLSDALGGEAFTLALGSVGANVVGPSAIIQP